MRRTMQSGTIRIGAGVSAWAALLLTIGACTPRVEVAAPEKPITINLNTAASSVFALSLDEVKAKGLVGEKRNGYLGTVNSSNAEAAALIKDVNQKRRQAYEDIAKRNRANVRAVETLAGEKAIQNTKPGHFIEGPAGWIKK